MDICIKKFNVAVSRVGTQAHEGCRDDKTWAAAIEVIATGKHAQKPAAWPIGGPSNVSQPIFEALAWRGSAQRGPVARMGAAMVQGSIDAAIAGAVVGLCVYMRVKHGPGPAQAFLWQHHLLLTSAICVGIWPVIWTFRHFD